jgi:hypothetical protein
MNLKEKTIQAAGSYPMPGLLSGPQGQNVDFKF